MDIKEYARLKLWAPIRINKHASYYSSHAQFGEDMIIRSLFPDTPKGTFIDIGAHHPVYYSNTYHLYQKGWRGLNLDAIPGSMQAFNSLRPADKNIEACIAAESGQDVTFYTFKNSAYNTIVEEMAESAKKQGQELSQTHQLKTQNINDLIEEYLPNRTIDFLNIDIEGVDELVLKSLNWEKYKPTVIAFEDHQFHSTLSGTTFEYLKQKGYLLKGLTGPTVIMQKEN